MPRKKKQDDAAPVEVPQPPDDLPAENIPAVNELLTLAQSLADDKAEVYERITANRTVLRNYQTMKLVSPEQWSAINEFYPPVKRTPKQDESANGDAPAPDAQQPAEDAAGAAA